MSHQNKLCELFLVIGSKLSGDELGSLSTTDPDHDNGDSDRAAIDGFDIELGDEELHGNLDIVIIDRYPTIQPGGSSSLPPSTSNSNQVDVVSRVSTAGIPMFCFPTGLKVQREMKLPTFFTFVTTDGDGQRMHGHCLTFTEEFRARISGTSAIEYVYIPKCLVILSKYGCFYAQFRTILVEIYRTSITVSDSDKILASSGLDTIFEQDDQVESRKPNIKRILVDEKQIPPVIPVERLVCNIVNDTPLPPRGRKCVTSRVAEVDILFSRAPLNLPIANTNGIAFRAVFECLCLDDILRVFSSALQERQMLVISSQYSLLTNFGEVLRAMMFPFDWQHVYIPVLPVTLIGFLQAPLPYIMGIHADIYQSKPFQEISPSLSESLIRIDLDNGRVIIPEKYPIEEIPASSRPKLLARLAEVAPAFIQRSSDWKVMVLPYYDLAMSQTARPSDSNSANADDQYFMREDGVVDVETQAQIKQALLGDFLGSYDNETRSASIFQNRSIKRAKCHWGLVRVAFLRFLISACANFRNFIMRSAGFQQSSSSTTASSMLATRMKNELVFDDKAFIESKMKNERAFYALVARSQHFRIFIDEVLRPSKHGPNPDIVFFEECIDARSNRLLQTRLFGGRTETPFISDPEYIHSDAAIVAHRPEPIQDMRLFKVLADRESKSKMRFFPRLNPILFTPSRLMSPSSSQEGLTAHDQAVNRVSLRSTGSGVSVAGKIRLRKDHQSELIRGGNNRNHGHAWILSNSSGGNGGNANENRYSGNFYQESRQLMATSAIDGAKATQKDINKNFDDYNASESILMRATRLLVSGTLFQQGSNSNRRQKIVTPEQAVYAAWFILYSLNIGRYSLHNSEKKTMLATTRNRLSERFDQESIHGEDGAHEKHAGAQAELPNDGLLRELSEEQLSLAFTVLDRAKSWNPPIEMDEVVYRSLIAACGRCGDVDRTIQVLGYMRDARIKPDSIVYSNLIQAFSVSGEHSSSKISSATLDMLNMLRWDDLPKEVEEASTRVHQRRRSLLSRRLSSKFVSERFHVVENTPSPMFQRKIRNWGTRSGKYSSVTSNEREVGMIQLTTSISSTSSRNVMSTTSSMLSGDTKGEVPCTPVPSGRGQQHRKVPSSMQAEPSTSTPFEKFKSLFAMTPSSATSRAAHANGNPKGGKVLRTESSSFGSKPGSRQLFVENPSIAKPEIPDYVLSKFPGLEIDTDRETCPNKGCNVSLCDRDIREGWSQDPNDYTTECPRCGHKFLAFFTVHSSDEKWHGSSGQGSKLFCEFISPWVVNKELQSYLMYNSTESIFAPEFRSTHSYLFWNLVLYWIEFNLPLEFFISASSILEDLNNDDDDDDCEEDDAFSTRTPDSPQTLLSDSIGSHQDRLSIRTTNSSFVVHDFELKRRSVNHFVPSLVNVKDNCCTEGENDEGQMEPQGEPVPIEDLDSTQNIEYHQKPKGDMTSEGGQESVNDELQVVDP